MDAEPRDAANTALLLDQEIDKRILLSICALLSRKDSRERSVKFLEDNLIGNLFDNQEFIRSVLIDLIFGALMDYTTNSVVQDSIANAIVGSLHSNPHGPLSVAIRNVIKDSL